MDRKKLLEASLRLRSAELRPFVEWLQSERELVLEMLSTAPEHAVGRLQGETQRLKKILDLIETAPAVLDKL